MIEKLARGSVGVEGAMAAAHSESSLPEQDNRSGEGGVRVQGALGRREEKENGMSIGWRSSWTGERKPRGSARSVPRRRRAVGQAVLLAVMARAGTTNRGMASGGKMSGRRVEAWGSRRCREAGLQRAAQRCQGWRSALATERSSSGARGRRRGEGVRGTGLQITKIQGAYR
jgi:hypothetical protein